jgi:glutathione peroxidase-family protein
LQDRLMSPWLTPQYPGLRQLWSEFHDRSLMIIGVPSNDLGEEEPSGRPTSPRWRNINMELPFRSLPRLW